MKLLTPDVSATRRKELRQGLLDYCERDTLALVRLVQRLRGVESDERAARG